MLLLIAIALLVVVPSTIASWQMGALGSGLIVIGLVLLIQRRRDRRRRRADPPDR